MDQIRKKKNRGFTHELEPSTAPFQLKLPSIEEIAKHLLHQWQKKLADHIDLESPETTRHRELWVTVIVARLKEGFTADEMEIAIDFVASSRNNVEWERRHVLAVFGESKRLRTLVEYGMSGATFAPPKSRPRAKRLEPIAVSRPRTVPLTLDINAPEDAASIMDRIEEEERNARASAQAEAGE